MERKAVWPERRRPRTERRRLRAGGSLRTVDHFIGCSQLLQGGSRNRVYRFSHTHT